MPLPLQRLFDFHDPETIGRRPFTLKLYLKFEGIIVIALTVLSLIRPIPSLFRVVILASSKGRKNKEKGGNTITLFTSSQHLLQIWSVTNLYLQSSSPTYRLILRRYPSDIVVFWFETNFSDGLGSLVHDTSNQTFGIRVQVLVIWQPRFKEIIVFSYCDIYTFFVVCVISG